MARLLVFGISFTIHVLRAAFRSRADLIIENIALRQQLATLIKERRRPALDDADRAFWVALRAAWQKWVNTLVIVKSDTVAKWHRERFRRHWGVISRHPGRPRIDATIRDLIREKAIDGWGAPRIYDELRKFGFEVSEVTVSRYMQRLPADPDQIKHGMVFLRNHKDVISAMDLFTVPTASLRVLYGFFVYDHSRRRILHFNATFNPTAAWVIQQLREAFPFDTAPKYLIRDRTAVDIYELILFTSFSDVFRSRMFDCPE